MYVTVNGARLFFDTAGSELAITPEGPETKPTLLVLHGGPGFDHWALRFYFDRFADIAQVIYIDHRGNGRSRGGAGSDPASWTLAQWGDDIAAFCDTLGIDRPIVLGQSFGGMVAQSYATRHPGHARGLIFSSTAASMRLDDVLDGFELLGGPDARRVAAAFWTRASEADIADYVRVCNPLYNASPRDPMSVKGIQYQWDVFRHFSLAAGEIWRMDFRPALAEVQVPTLVLTGEHDPVTPPQRSREIFAALNPGIATLTEVPGTGHGTFRDAPDISEKILRNFFKTLG